MIPKNDGGKPFLWLVLASSLLMAGLLWSAHSQAFEWVVDKPILNRGTLFWHYNPENCPPETLQDAHRAFLAWGRYLPFEVVYGGETSAGEAYDGKNVISCASILEFTNAGYPFGKSAVTQLSVWQGRLIMEGDVVLNADRYFDCVVMHEVGHVLGLHHSADEGAVMNESCRKPRLGADDIVGISTLYGQTPDCTPSYENGVLHLPMVAGFEVWAEAVDRGDLSRGFRVVEAGEAPEGEWACDLDVLKSGESIAMSVYYKGFLVQLVLEKEGEIWRLNY